MSLSVAYWTSAFYPEMEAIAGEVALLRRHFRPSVAWGVSSARWFQLSWRRGFGVHPRMHLGFRAATWAFQRAFRVNHVFGGLGDWFHLKAVRKRPLVLTVAANTTPCDKQLLDRVDRFIVEWPAAQSQLTELGIERKRIELIYPPVDLERFRPTLAPEEPYTVLFASSPDRPDWLQARGVPLLLDAAARLPQVRFRFLWRPWGKSLPTVRREIQTRDLSNVELQCGVVKNMASEYQQTHVTVAPFTEMSCCKAIPNSLVESLACGRPVVATDLVGISPMIQHHRCGSVCSPSVDGLCKAIEDVIANYSRHADAARPAAQRWFSATQFVKKYRSVYETVLAH